VDEGNKKEKYIYKENLVNDLMGWDMRKNKSFL